MAARKAPPKPRRPTPSATQRGRAILRVLRRTYPNARCELDYANPWQLLVAVVLSAQCTDVNVNKATPALFERFPTPQSMAGVDAREVEPFIRSLGLFRTKARALVVTAHRLVEQHGGQVPRERQALEALPGVGRKTASVVLANAFGVPALAVDTHVGRLARRMGFTTQQDPRKVEDDLCALWPREAWVDAHHALILHGRRVCSARAPDCARCAILPHCPQKGL